MLVVFGNGGRGVGGGGAVVGVMAVVGNCNEDDGICDCSMCDGSSVVFIFGDGVGVGVCCSLENDCRCVFALIRKVSDTTFGVGVFFILENGF